MNSFTATTMRAFVARRSRVRISSDEWRALVAELGRRGRGDRESGAFLLAPRQGHRARTVAQVVYFDDVDPESLTGGITMHSSGFEALWAICSEQNLRVIGDVHTHPSAWVDQSGTDRDNPMIATAGHVAIIVPNLALQPITAADCGVHVYHGAHRWTNTFNNGAARLLYIGRWA